MVILRPSSLGQRETGWLTRPARHRFAMLIRYYGMEHTTGQVPRVPRLTELFRAHASELYRFARRLTRNPDDALDLVQDTFVQAAQCFERLPTDPQAERAWLHGFASARR